MYKEVFEKVHTILQLAMEISTTTVADVCVDYYAPVGNIFVRIFRHGRCNDKENVERYDCYFSHPNGWKVSDSFRDPSFDEIIAKLEELKEQAEKLPESEVTKNEHC